MKNGAPKVYEVKLTVKEKTSDVKVEKKSKGILESDLDAELDKVTDAVKERL